MPRNAKSVEELVATLEAKKESIPDTPRGRLRKLAIDNEIKDLRTISDRRGL